MREGSCMILYETPLLQIFHQETKDIQTNRKVDPSDRTRLLIALLMTKIIWWQLTSLIRYDSQFTSLLNLITKTARGRRNIPLVSKVSWILIWISIKCRKEAKQRDSWQVQTKTSAVYCVLESQKQQNE